MLQLIDSTVTAVRDNADGTLLRRDQFIPDDHLQALRDERDESGSERAHDYHRVCSIPTQVADVWLAQGFDVFKESPKAILKRLRDEGLDHFISTRKAI